MRNFQKAQSAWIETLIGETEANWHPGRIGTQLVSAHVPVANLWR